MPAYDASRDLSPMDAGPAAVPVGSGGRPAQNDDVLQRLESLEAELAATNERVELLTLPDEEPANSDFYVDYEKGFLIRPVDDDNPFRLRINGRLQMRHTAFERDITTFVDQAGNVEPIHSRNDFEVERGRLEFRATMIDPNLHYYLNIDFDTDDNHRLVAHDTWVYYSFSDAFNFYVGKSKVPGSRAWLLSSSRFRFADRSMATTFFRPDRSVGIWAMGELGDAAHYELFVGNGFATTDRRFDDLDEQFVYSASFWWEPWDEFGKGYTDIEYHRRPALQIGHSFTYTSQQGVDGGGTTEETSFRLSDGTLLITPGALANNVMVTAFDVYLYAVDMGFKYRGISVNTEWYFRWLQALEGTGALPLDRLFDHGFFVDAGIFLVPERFELIGRVSQVDGLFGDGWEYAGGVNWYINGTHHNKLTFDVTVLDRNPASSSSPNLIAGADGTMFRTQWQVAF